MNANRKTAITTGVLFILATAAGLAGSAMLAGALKGQDFLVQISAQGSRVLVSALLSFIAACASSGIAIALYPVLRKESESLALTAVGFRLVEGVYYTIGTICLLSLFALSQQIAAGAQTPSDAPIIGHLLLTAKDVAGFVVGVMAFCIGAAAYYIVFWRSQLIPRWLSGWGIVSLLLLLLAVLMTLFDGEPYSVSGYLVFLAMPIALQEMVMAVWLIARGFHTTAIASLSAKG